MSKEEAPTCPKCGAPMVSTKSRGTVSLFYKWKCTKCTHFEGYGSIAKKPESPCKPQPPHSLEDDDDAIQSGIEQDFDDWEREQEDVS